MSQSKHCPRCGGDAKPTNHTRSSVEHGLGHLGGHTIKHNPLLGALMGGAALFSDLVIPRNYACTVCGHTFLL